MADKNLLQQMLESLVNDDQAKAEELFHEYVVAQSREIYESMIDSEIDEAAEEDDEEVDESSHKDEDEEDDEDLDENFGEVAIEGDDEMDLDSADPTDDLVGEIGPEEDENEFADKSEAELFQDLDSIVDELQAKFDEMNGEDKGDMGGDDMGGDDMGGDDMGMKDDFDLATVREYVEKKEGGFGSKIGGDNGVNTKSLVAGKNDMGGTTANIAKSFSTEKGGTEGGLLKPSTQPQNGGNINVPGGKAGSSFSKKEPGHGAEKAGSKESADNKQSLFRGRR
jgi:hypothetical protein